MLVIALSACAKINITYRSSGSMRGSIASAEFALIKSSYSLTDRTGAQLALTAPTQLRVGDVENVIVGTLLKHRISVLTKPEFDALEQSGRSKCLVVEWGASGRSARGTKAGFSQEVTVLIRNAHSGEIVYQGVGEYMGETEIDDLRGALLAALAGFGASH